jgi:O-antigen ligase
MALRMLDEKIESNNFKLILFGLACIVLVIFSSNYVMSYWWAHAITCLLASIFLKRISHYSITWILIANVVIFSNQSRFSLEFLLLALGLSAWAFSDSYQKFSKKQRSLIVLSLIAVNVLFTLIGKNLNDPYSLLSWLPILVSFYFPLKESFYEKKNFIANAISIFLVSFSSKKSVILSFLGQYISRLRSIKSFLVLALISVAIFFTSFLFQDKLNKFYVKSVQPRLVIWQSASIGFLQKPIGGNGFGIFPMEINQYRKIVQKIGGKLEKHVSHGHNNFLHIAFEQGIIGLSIFALFLFFLFKSYNSCFWAFLTLSLLDANLAYTNQFLIFALIFAPDLRKFQFAFFDNKYLVLPQRYHKISHQLLVIITLISFGFSVIGHYYYDHKKYEMALKFDSDNSLYHFFLGVKNYKQSKFKRAKIHFEKSVELSKNHGFQQGFLAVTNYMLGDKKGCQDSIIDAMKLAGDIAHWKYIGHIIFKEIDLEYATKLRNEAIVLDPIYVYFEKNIRPPEYKSIGGHRNSEFWINSYQRRGDKVYLPSPQL